MVPDVELGSLTGFSFVPEHHLAGIAPDARRRRLVRWDRAARWVSVREPARPHSHVRDAPWVRSAGFPAGAA
eukprot:scaffold1309_cov117-Isochrysis_galbana.AAC.14